MFNTVKLSFLNAKIRGLKSKLLTPEEFNALVGSKTLQAMIRILSYTDYSKYISKQAGLELSERDVDSLLNKAFIDALESIRMVSLPELRSLLTAIRSKYEAAVLKTLLRLKFSGEPVQKALMNVIPVGLFSEKTIMELFSKGTLKSMIESIPDEGYRNALTSAWRDFEREKVMLPLEIALDYYTFIRMLNSARRILTPEDYLAIYNYMGRVIDVTNINIILRSKIFNLNPVEIQRMIVREGRYIKKDLLLAAIRSRNIEEAVKHFMTPPFDEYLSVGWKKYQAKKEFYLIENMLEKCLYDKAKLVLSTYPFQIQTPLAFIDLKFYEVNSIKTIVIALLEGIPPSEIREYLIC
ncbi:MAG: V-type ATPase subunit [Candidatus Odinarchaeum yellowstonii]|jgi:vacuolar-type H+-ATPase subunit C/Vma6|uniref:V-type ATPase subunit n=1 Tax=Odinarchaeota yellowstonii (strain LCB_4) TaxID=1841599 RepID=A0AAF0D1L8_ODILC|nr:MAG: V-type ATPase subunit [Candidatus Odinarchaeum yellowstonii]